MSPLSITLSTVAYLLLASSSLSFARESPPLNEFQFKKWKHSFVKWNGIFINDRKVLFMPLSQYSQLSFSQKKRFIDSQLRELGTSSRLGSIYIEIRYIIENETNTKTLKYLYSKLRQLKIQSKYYYFEYLALKFSTLGYLQKKLGATSKEKVSLLKEINTQLQMLEKTRPLLAVYVKTEFGIKTKNQISDLVKLSKDTPTNDDTTLASMTSSWGLQALGGTKALAHLVSCVAGKFKKPKHHREPKWYWANTHRYNCIAALARLGGTVATKAIAETFSKETTIDAKREKWGVDAQWVIFATATAALHELGQTEIIKSLENKVLKKGNDLVEAARLGIVAGLLRIGRGRKIAQAVALEKKQTPETLLENRWLILEWLSYLPDKTAKDILRQGAEKSIKNKETSTPIKVFTALLRSNETKGVRILWKYIRNNNEFTDRRKYALKALAYYHPKKYIPLIVSKFRTGSDAVNEYVRDLYVGRNGARQTDIGDINYENPKELHYTKKPTREDFIKLIKEKRKYKPCRNTCEILEGFRVWAKNKYLQNKDRRHYPISHWKYSLKSMGAIFVAKAARHCPRGYQILNGLMLNWFDLKEKKIDENLLSNLPKKPLPARLIRNLKSFNEAFWKLEANFAIGGWGITFHVELIDMLLRNRNLQKALGLDQDKKYVQALKILQNSNQRKLHLLVKGYKRLRRDVLKGGRERGSYFHTHLLATAANVVRDVPKNVTDLLVHFAEKNNWPYGPNRNNSGTQKGSFARQVPGYFFLYNRVRSKKRNIPVKKWATGLFSALKNYLDHFPEARLLYDDSPEGSSPHSGEAGLATYYRPVTNAKAQLSIWYLLHDPQMKAAKKKLIKMSYELGGFMNALHDKEKLIEPQDLKTYPGSPFYVNALGGKAYAIACDIEKKFVRPNLPKK